LQDDRKERMAHQETTEAHPKKMDQIQKWCSP
jgi:hypothetical protein